MSQLLATQLVMMEKDKEILKLKDELARQQNSIQQTSEQNFTKQQKEFQEQIKQMIVQKEAERSALKSQIQQLRTRFLQKYYPNMYTKGSPVFPNTTDQTPTVHNTMKQTSTIGTMTIQTQTEDQDTQDNTPPTPSDTTRHPMAYPDTKPDFEQDPELDSKDQNILAIETTETLDNYIDNSDPTFKNEHNSSINDCTDIKQIVDNSDIGDPNESKTETTDDKMQDQTDNIDNDDQDNYEFESKEIIQTDNNTLNSPIDFNNHNSSMETQAETDNSHKESEPIESEDEGDPKPFESESIDFDIGSDVGSEHDFENLEAIRLQHKQEIRAIDFDPNLHTQVSECADINAIKSNNLTCLNCKSPDHLVKDCLEPNKKQQLQSNKRQNNSIESAIKAPTQTLKNPSSNQKSHGYSKPKQPFHHKRANPHAKPRSKPTYRPHNNKDQHFKGNSKYQKQTAHNNGIENYEAQYKAMYLNMCENFTAKIPANKPIPLFSFG